MTKPVEKSSVRPIPVPLRNDYQESLDHLVAESRRLKPAWKDTPQSVLTSIVEDFLDQPDAFDRFILIRVGSEEEVLLRQIAELKNLKRAVRAGTLDEPISTEAANPSLNLGSVSPTVDKPGR